MTADELRAARADLSLSQAELAQALGIAVTTVARWEQGAYKIPPYLALTLRQLAVPR